jgi:thymidylate synthase
MIHVFEGRTADQVWMKAFDALQGGEYKHLQQGRGGSTEEVLHAIFCIQDPRQKWITTRQPTINPAFAIAEVVWIVSGRNDAAFLNYWNSQLPKFGGHTQTYHGAYGFRLRNHFGIDQLERAYLALKNNEHNRQVVLEIWDSKIDLPDEFGQPVAKDIPCNITSLLKIRNNKLEWMQILRSNDLFLGVPYNIIQFTSLQEVMAGWLGTEVGSYNHLSDSLHIYSRDKSKISISNLDNCVDNTDSLGLPKVESDKAFGYLNQSIDKMISSTISKAELEEIVSSCQNPISFKNLLLILAAECARKKGWKDLVQQYIDSCSNQSLKNVWLSWASQR